jgi:ABC-type phosphate transport system substrate-binding protein
MCKNEPTGLTKAFIDFTLSDQGKQILDQQGLITTGITP